MGFNFLQLFFRDSNFFFNFRLSNLTRTEKINKILHMEMMQHFLSRKMQNLVSNFQGLKRL